MLGVLGVLNVLNVLNLLNVLNVLNVLNMPHGRIVGLLGLVFYFKPMEDKLFNQLILSG